MNRLSNGGVNIIGEGESDDVKILKDALTNKSNQMWMGYAGTAMRFGLAWAASTKGTRIIDGEERLRQRPIAPLVNALRALGANIEYIQKENFLPLRVKGQTLEGGEVQVAGNLSSQFVSALLLIAPYFKKGLVLKLDSNQVSKSYIQMTVDIMEKAGAEIELSDSSIKVLNNPYKPIDIEVEPDWSAASYFYVWALLNPRLKISLLDLRSDSIQGDRRIVEEFRKFGVNTQFNDKGAFLSAIKPQIPASISFLEIPDMAQTFAVAAVGLKKQLQLNDLSTLRFKETDRIKALQYELEKMGVSSIEEEDSLEITSFSDWPQEISVHTYEDHRMAMAFSPLVSVCGTLHIQDPDVVTKSFPDYWIQVARLGVQQSRT